MIGEPKFNGSHDVCKGSVVKSNEKSEKWPNFKMDYCYFNTGITLEYFFLLDFCGICKICLEING